MTTQGLQVSLAITSKDYNGGRLRCYFKIFLIQNAFAKIEDFSRIRAKIQEEKNSNILENTLVSSQQ